MSLQQVCAMQISVIRSEVWGGRVSTDPHRSALLRTVFAPGAKKLACCPWLDLHKDLSNSAITRCFLFWTRATESLKAAEFAAEFTAEFGYAGYCRK